MPKFFFFNGKILKDFTTFLHAYYNHPQPGAAFSLFSVPRLQTTEEEPEQSEFTIRFLRSKPAHDRRHPFDDPLLTHNQTTYQLCHTLLPSLKPKLDLQCTLRSIHSPTPIKTEAFESQGPLTLPSIFTLVFLRKFSHFLG